MANAIILIYLLYFLNLVNNLRANFLPYQLLITIIIILIIINYFIISEMLND